ncbi:hypothetical protein D9619_012040 [Psilocybe cf. subviscida]|uniref:Thioredoxin n=1 Tax=Psilocybe cf. subviscida TaxID=2480587 RepID=A0A8H5B7I3_9AGAR|nr:hypothetical protein D9619_012040 [Psilocybe cf. subviscida]
MVVKAITSFKEFQTIIDGKEPVVIDFWATWCGPCRMISPIFEEISGKTEGVGFYKVDVDEQDAISHELGIRAMPTFVLFQNGNKLGEMTGAIPSELEALVAKGVALHAHGK